MKIIKKNFLLLTFSTILLFSGCGCKPGYYLYDITDYNTVNLFYKKDPTSGGLQEITTDNYIVKYDILFVKLKPRREKIGSTNECTVMNDSTIRYIAELDIYSNKNYNDNFKVGTNLNELFYSFTYSNQYIQDTLMIKDVVGKNYNVPNFYMILKEPPSQTDTFVFDIHIKLDDGRIYELQSRPIIITP